MQGGEAQQAAEAEDAMEERPASLTGFLIFLSARPESYRGWTEQLSFRELFEPLVQAGRLPVPPLLLLGSIRSGPLALWDYSGLARGMTCAPLPAALLHLMLLDALLGQEYMWTQSATGVSLGTICLKSIA